MAQSADRNLLFGIIALQMDFISRDALISAMHGWVIEKQKSLGEVLVGHQAMSEDERLLLDSLVNKHLERHGEDAGRSLSALSPVGWIKHDLEAIADPALGISLARLAEASARTDPDATANYEGVAPGSSGARFRVLRPHARGGLGEVYVAHDEELNREVALKRIQDEYADHPESRARFLMEAEVTGGLEHPGVVPVYGLGHFSDGRPFYAMRFIRGDSLKEAIAQFHRDEAGGRDPGERSLALRRLLGRFIDVCNAVAYAHSRGVLHRDLKPGNIMLGPYGETLVVDWGLAKSIARREEGGPGARGESTLRPASESGFEPTRMGSAIGTPAYMSPEQAEGRLERLGPASDVYSLGATLYCLLTGRAPIAGADTVATLDRVRNGMIPAPRQVKPEVPRALEAVCQKAMALRPEDRYSTPKPLADDLEHWLADQPVSAARAMVDAAPPLDTAAQTAVAGAAAVLATALVALAAGFVAVSLQKQETERQRQRAETNFGKAANAVERLLTRVGQERLKDIPQLESLRGELLEDALQFQLGFLNERSHDPFILFGVARAARKAADLELQLNRLADAERTGRQALSMVDELVARSPRELSYRRERAAVLDTLGLTLATLDRTDQAESAYRQAIDVRGLVLTEHPGSTEDRWLMAGCLNHLGVLLRDTGRWDEAQQFFVRGRQLCQADPTGGPGDPRIRQELVAILGHLGLMLMDRGHRGEALENYAGAVQAQRALIDAEPRTSAHRELLVILLLNQANALVADSQPAAAERNLVEARDLAERLRTDYPSIARYHDLACSVLNNLGNAVKSDPARASLARDILGRAIAMQEELVALSPAVPDYLSKLATMCDSLATLLRAQKAFDSAEALYRKGLSYQSRLAALHPQHFSYRYGHGQALHNLADLLRERGRPGEGLPIEQQAVDHLMSVYQSNVRNPEYRMAISYASWTLCAILLDLKDHRSAVKAVLEYQRIESGGFEESYESAGILCRCARLCREDESIPAAERETLARSYCERAIDALRAAVRNGFRDVDKLKTATTYEPLRSRDDFRRLVREVEAMSGAARPPR